MPPKVLPRGEDIRKISDELKQRKFYPIQGLQHFRDVTKDERAIPPRPRKGAELGFVYRKDDLSVVVWTGYVLADGESREKDSGWVVIDEAGEAKYFVKLHRTKNFVDRILLEARIATWRVRNRPKCSTCGLWMEVTYGKGRGSRYWRCPVRHTRESWDSRAFLEKLPVSAKEYLTEKRKRRREWYKKCRAMGMPIRQAMFRRKRWERIALPVEGF